jgi:hypothetical protein
MSDERDPKPTLSTMGQRAAEQRRQRLAAALRENLRKRKAWQHARSTVRQASPRVGGDENGDDGNV